MINILLADDDILTLNQLNMYISPLKGYRIIGQVQNGTDAISFLEKNSETDLIILDMEMPELSGKDVADYIQKHALPVVILVLSNYDNFEYVKPVLRLGAWDYLLKHELNCRLIEEKLNEISNYLSKKKQHIFQTDFVVSLTRQDFLRRLALNQTVPEEQISYVLNDSAFCGSCYSLILMQITNYMTIYQNNYENRHQKIIDMVLNLANTILSSLGLSIITHIDTGEFLIFINFHSEASLAAQQLKKQQYINVLKSNILKYLNINTIFESVLVYDKVRNLRTYYLKIHHSLQHQPFNSQSDVAADKMFLITINQEKALLNAVSNCDAAETSHILHQVFKPLKNQDVPLKQLQHLVNRLSEIIGLLFQEYPGLSEVFPPPVQSPDLLEIDSLEKYWVNYYIEVISKINMNPMQDYPPLIKTALFYIHQNFTQDISLHSTAEACGITDAYLSKIFKQSMKISFSKYLSDYRIKIASWFLCETQYSLKEISCKSGFQNYNYFLTVFKNSMGMTPVQYRMERSPSLSQTIEQKTVTNITVNRVGGGD